MNLIKSVFILLAPLVLMVIVYKSIVGLLDSSELFLNIGLLLSSLPLLLFIAALFIFKNIARTNQHLPWVSVPSFVGYCLVLFVFIKTSNIQYIDSMVYSLAAFFITFLYVYWYSTNGRKIAKNLVKSQQLIEFKVKDSSGNAFSSNQFIGQKTLLFFFRGNWCPLCMAQINEIVSLYKKFEEKGINVVFISPQPASHTESLSKRFDLAFKFYRDENNQAANQLGINHKFGLPMGFQALGYDSDSVYPTVIATNEKGEILYSDQTSNYRIRPEPEDLLAIFQ